MKATLRPSNVVCKRPVLALVVMSLAYTTPAFSTVYEFNADGKVTVTETSPKSTEPAIKQRSNPEIEALRSLTRDVALWFSGAAGGR